MVHLPQEYVLLIGGKGPLRKELQELIDRLGLQERVKLLGFISDSLKPAYFGACDVFCLSSTLKTEAYAIVQVEAMSLGRPIVATEIPGSGVAWVNAHQKSGLNVPIEDAQALAQAIQKICQDPELWSTYSKGSRQRFFEVFTKDEMINQLIRTYTELLHPTIP